MAAGGVRINFGDAYIGRANVAVPLGCLAYQDRIEDDYLHVGTIAIAGRTNEILNDTVLLMQRAICYVVLWSVILMWNPFIVFRGVAYEYYSLHAIHTLSGVGRSWHY
jgi:hypothetical protein